MLHNYALTVSPPRRSYDDVKQYRHDIYNMRKIHARIEHFLVIPELSWEGRLHYHGVFLASKKDMVWVKKTLGRRTFNLGYLKITKLKTFKDKLTWLIYCKKDWWENRFIFDNYMAPHTLKKWVYKPRKLLTILDRYNAPRGADRRIQRSD